MLYHCRQCGRIYREEDVNVEEAYLAEAWGRPIYEKYITCPECGDNVDEYFGDPYEDDDF